MKLSSIELSRVLGFIDLNDLTPRGTVALTRIVPGLVEKMRFTAFPTSLDQFDETKGVEFKDGLWDGIPIQKMTVYNNGIMMDTRNGTDSSLRIINELLAWSAHEFALTVPTGGVQKFRFLNQFTFISDILPKFGGLPVRRLAENVSRSLQGITGKSRHYEVIRIDCDFDRFEEKAPIAPFTIQRRVTASFEEGKFYSEAPLPTDVHWAVLEQFEADILANT